VSDLHISGGTVVDGTGAPGIRADVVVEGDRLRVVGPGESDAHRAARTIDATGKVVAPGFIDLHSHSGLWLLADGRHEPKVRQGVTTEVIGVDGNAYAPFPSRADLLDFVVLNGGLDGRPEIAYDWDTVASYLSRFDGRISVNVAYLVGNSALRIAALGWEDIPTTPKGDAGYAGDVARGDGRGCLRREFRPRLPARLYAICCSRRICG